MTWPANLGGLTSAFSARIDTSSKRHALRACTCAASSREEKLVVASAALAVLGVLDGVISGGRRSGRHARDVSIDPKEECRILMIAKGDGPPYVDKDCTPARHVEPERLVFNV